MTSFPYARTVVLAVGAAAVLTILLNLRLHDWPAALNVATVGVFEVITLVLAVRALVRWIINRRRPDDDPPGYQKDFGLAA
ncbi:MAG: hypothetical protein KDB72_03035 [Mycobacterium sp.]|nr:hypothetical protein [Mycobacterium sp.]